jgi:hypothetical protein
MVAASGLGACSGGSDDKPATAPPKTSSAPDVTTPAPTPTIPPQPQGANGVTYEIQNWDQYANDPAVLAWKQTLEAFGASTNAGKVLEPMRAGMAKRVLRPYVESLEQAWSGGWHVEPVGKVKVESATTSGEKAELVTCQWAPTTAFLKKNGEAAGGASADATNIWAKQNLSMALKNGRWVITKFTYDGTCGGAAP